MEETSRTCLHVYDFDGTLFKSPIPSPKLWHPNLFGKLMEDIDTGLGWFQDKITLSEPYVPSKPGPEWFNQDVVESVRNSMKRKDTITVLLTGRNKSYKDSIDSIISQCGLEFHEKGFKPQTIPIITTKKFKKQFLLDIIEKYSSVNVEIWEDRPNHSKDFKLFFSELTKNSNSTLKFYKIHQVKTSSINLPQELEKDLVEQLIQRNLKCKAVLKPMVLSTSVVIDPSSRQNLFQIFPCPNNNWEIHADHMTICDGSLEDNKLIGEKVELKVAKIGKSEKVVAVQVDTDLAFDKKIKHIILYASPYAKKNEVNSIKDWKDVKETEYAIQLIGSIQESILINMEKKKMK